MTVTLEPRSEAPPRPTGVRAGRLVVARHPMLTGHRGGPPDLLLKPDRHRSVELTFTDPGQPQDDPHLRRGCRAAESRPCRSRATPNSDPASQRTGAVRRGRSRQQGCQPAVAQLRLLAAAMDAAELLGAPPSTPASASPSPRACASTTASHKHLRYCSAPSTRCRSCRSSPHPAAGRGDRGGRVQTGPPRTLRRLRRTVS
jgi:hypothetical protein